MQYNTDKIGFIGKQGHFSLIASYDEREVSEKLNYLTQCLGLSQVPDHQASTEPIRHAQNQLAKGSQLAVSRDYSHPERAEFSQFSASASVSKSAAVWARLLSIVSMNRKSSLMFATIACRYL